jgi:predicted DNA-binding protein (MmcQ/YjbR family)
MDIEFLREYCLSKSGTSEGTPFGPDVLVIKVMGKMFCLFSIANFVSVNLKCDPDKAIQLREEYTAVEPGFHMNKTHWNTVRLFLDIDNAKLLSLVDHSYELVVRSLTKKLQAELASL